MISSSFAVKDLRHLACCRVRNLIAYRASTLLRIGRLRRSRGPLRILFLKAQRAAIKEMTRYVPLALLE